MRVHRRMIITLAFAAAGPAPQAIPQASTVTWCAFDMGFAEARGGTILLEAAAGQQFVGVAQTSTEGISGGFLSNPWLFQPASSVPVRGALPQTYSLWQNFPNPFNPSTRIRFDLPRQSYVTLTLYNILGQEIARLVDGIQEAGVREIVFDARTLASGVYFYRMHARSSGTGNDGDFTALKKLMILK